MRSRKALLNTICAALLQMITIISGLILPRMIISSFGSEVNGMIASITQLIAYLSLLEAGVGGVVKASLFKPLAQGDTEAISRVARSTENFFRKIAIFSIAYSFVLAGTYYFINSEFNLMYSGLMVLIVCLGTIAQYYFGLTYQLLLFADQRAYIYYVIQVVTIILNLIISVIMIKLGFGVHLVKLLSVSVFAIRPIALNIYVSKRYGLNKKAKPDENAIKQRWSGLGFSIASFVHKKTDIFLLTIFTTLSEVSVYSVYSVVATGLTSVSTVINDSFQAAFGNMMAQKEDKALLRNFRVYILINNQLIFTLFATAIVMILPFVAVYTKDIEDANYLRPGFSVLILLSEMFFCLRQPYQAVVTAAGHYRQTQKGAFFEAGINIVISLVLVNRFGLSGIVFGTLVSMIYRTLDYAIYIQKHIVFFKLREFFKRLFVSFASAGVILLFTHNFMLLHFQSFRTWLLSAVLVAIISAVVCMVFNLAFYREDVTAFMNTIKNIKMKKVLRQKEEAGAKKLVTDIPDNINELFSAWNEAGIKYCHWKSNEHLIEGLCGKTDLDILVDEADTELVRELLDKFNFKQVIPHSWNRYNKVEDWIGLDKITGVQTHFHLHFSLITGKKNVKEQYLPWDRLVLDNRILDSETNVYICCPDIEIIILICRLVLKRFNFRVIPNNQENYKMTWPEQIELDYLFDLIDLERVLYFATQMLNSKSAYLLISMVKRHRFKNRKMRVFKKALVEGLEAYRHMSLMKVDVLSFYRYLWEWVRIKLRIPMCKKKLPVSGGKLISFIGVDGSGKTTLATLLAKWLSWKIDCRYVYLGTGEGKSSLTNRIYREIMKKRSNNQEKVKEGSDKALEVQPEIKPVSFKQQLRITINNYVALSNASYKYKTVKKIHRYRRQGKIIITDRFPQLQFWGINDGLSITTEKTGCFNVINSYMQRREKAIMRKICLLQPDVVIKLKIPFEVSRQRKTDSSEELIKRKIWVVDQLKYAGADEVYVDSSKTLEETIDEVKNVIWEYV